MNTADIFSLLHLFHLFTFLWHRPTLPKPYVGKARPKALKDDMHRLGRVAHFDRNPALPKGQPLRGS